MVLLIALVISDTRIGTDKIHSVCFIIFNLTRERVTYAVRLTFTRKLYYIQPAIDDVPNDLLLILELKFRLRIIKYTMSTLIYC